MADLMLQFHHEGARPGLDEVRGMFHLDPADVDADYGVVPTDPSQHLYVVRVREQAASRVRAALAARPEHPAEGLFGDPRIEATGPPDPG